MTLYEVNEAAEAVREAATDDTNIIFGATIDDRLDGPDVDHRRCDGHRQGSGPRGTIVTASSGERGSARNPVVPARPLEQIEDDQAEEAGDHRRHAHDRDACCRTPDALARLHEVGEPERAAGEADERLDTLDGEACRERIRHPDSAPGEDDRDCAAAHAEGSRA